RLDDVERQAALPRLEDELAVLERADRGESGQGFHLGIAQLREREVMNVITGRQRLDLRGSDRITQPSRRGFCQRSSLYHGSVVTPATGLSRRLGRPDTPTASLVSTSMTHRTAPPSLGSRGCRTAAGGGLHWPVATADLARRGTSYHGG